MEVSTLTNKELCQIRDILKECEKIEYAKINERISSLKELERFGERFVRWVADLDIHNVYVRMAFLSMSINYEMSDRFYKLNLEI